LFNRRRSALLSSVKFGITIFVTDRSIGMLDVARAVEERGFDSLFVPEHSHIPLSRKTPYPLGGEPLPDEYKRILDPFVALSAAAAVTTRIRIGTGICLVAQRDPIHTAKEVATLDLLSNGRFVFGVGIGWNEDEAEDHGVDFKRRRSALREKVLAMKELWTKDEASYRGELVKLPPSWQWPKPAQKPHPAIFFGGIASPKLFAHVAEYADGWMPLGGSGLKSSIPELHRAFESAGRDPKSARITAFGVMPDAAKLEYYRGLGVEEAVFFVPTGGKDSVLPLLDRYAEIVRSVAGKS
jgi:probable F420-dependent oxidoreductase